MKTKNLVEIVEDKQKKRLKHLMTHFQRWRLRYWRTHRVKNCKRSLSGFEIHSNSCHERKPDKEPTNFRL